MSVMKRRTLLALAAVAVVLFGLTLSSCKDCNSGKNRGNRGKGKDPLGDRSSTGNSADKNNPDMPLNGDRSSTGSSVDKNNPDMPLNTDSSAPLISQEQELDAVLDVALMEIREVAEKVKAQKEEAKGASEKKVWVDQKSKIDAIGRADDNAKAAINESKLMNDREDGMQATMDAVMRGIARASLKAKAQEVAKAAMEAYKAIAEINRMLAAEWATVLVALLEMRSLLDETLAWANATRWAALGEENALAHTFATNMTNAKATMKKKKDTWKKDNKKDANYALNLATLERHEKKVTDAENVAANAVKNRPLA
jgi:hypothetical protein